MKVLVVGSGGREHALAWKFAQSDKVQRVFVAPGNGGTAMEAKCENVPLAVDPASAQGQEELKQFALGETIDLAVIGPELPLAEGLADTLRDAGLEVIGPGKEAARLEASKIYSKAFMAKYGIRTARGSDFTDPEKARAFAVEHFTPSPQSPNPIPPLVIKADGLAAGKGVIIAHNLNEAEAALDFLMRDKSLGDAGTSVLLEEFLEGTEVSVLAAVSVAGGKGFILPFISARDHKRRFDGAQGPNTGGMGAIAPVPDFSPAAQDDFRKSILEPTLEGMKAEGLDYRGFIFFGLMVRADRCYLLEYNVRLGDPETQAVLPLVDFDLVDLCAAILSGEECPLAWKPGAVCAPVAVADGYPGPYRRGDAIAIDAAALEKTGAKVFVSGAAAKAVAGTASGKTPSLLTSGGRVLTVFAYGKNAAEARSAAYQGLAAIDFDGMGFRRDIGMG
ncbi:MAG: phosphoribosylamine--glycine ligase [Treponema sp.]|nr:phosphoribosylamine--glycine ligase [Treponema sp.]